MLYAWRDGDRTRHAWLQTDLVLQPSAENTADDVVVEKGARESIVERSERHTASNTQPVFVSQSGTLMTLPGGVVLVLLEAWDEARIDDFFAEHGIARQRAVEQGFAPNAYLIETEPGLPSLHLANALADQEGVRIAVPNWSREVVLR